MQAAAWHLHASRQIIMGGTPVQTTDTRGDETNGHAVGCRQTGGLTVALEIAAASSQGEHADVRCWLLAQLLISNTDMLA